MTTEGYGDWFERELDNLEAEDEFLAGETVRDKGEWDAYVDKVLPDASRGQQAALGGERVEYLQSIGRDDIVGQETVDMIAAIQALAGRSSYRISSLF